MQPRFPIFCIPASSHRLKQHILGIFSLPIQWPSTDSGYIFLKDSRKSKLWRERERESSVWLIIIKQERKRMCVQDAEQVSGGMEDMGLPSNDDSDSEGSVKAPPLRSQVDFSGAQNENWDNKNPSAAFDPVAGGRISFPLESISEDSTVAVRKQMLNNFLPILRSGEWSDIGGRLDMEDTHICIPNLAMNFGSTAGAEEVISFYGVFDGHGGKGAAQFVRDHLPRIIVEDADFPLELEKVVTRSFVKTDAAFAKSCCVESTLSSGTTALTAMIFGRSLLVANAGDCRAVLSRGGVAIDMSEDHRPSCANERTRIESLGGYIDDGYLNGQLGVTRAIGDWHIKGLKEGGKGGPLSAEPELKLMTLTKEDEFLIIGSDGMWDVFRSQNAVDFARRRLQEHNNVKLCCKDIVNEAKKRVANDNVTVVMVSFYDEPPPPVVVRRPRVRRCISAEGLQSLKCLLQG